MPFVASPASSAETGDGWLNSLKCCGFLRIHPAPYLQAGRRESTTASRTEGASSSRALFRGTTDGILIIVAPAVSSSEAKASALSASAMFTSIPLDSRTILGDPSQADATDLEMLRGKTSEKQKTAAGPSGSNSSCGFVWIPIVWLRSPTATR